MRLLLLVLSIALLPACELRVPVDEYADNYLAFSIYQTSADRVADGAPKFTWEATMSPNPEYSCEASNKKATRTCAHSKTQGSASTAEEAKAAILAHFDEFKVNNRLLPQP